MIFNAAILFQILVLIEGNFDYMLRIRLVGVAFIFILVLVSLDSNKRIVRYRQSCVAAPKLTMCLVLYICP